MAAPGALAAIIALSATIAATMPVRAPETAKPLPRIALHVPQTVPAAPSPHAEHVRALLEDDVDVTGPRW